MLLPPFQIIGQHKFDDSPFYLFISCSCENKNKNCYCENFLVMNDKLSCANMMVSRLPSFLGLLDNGYELIIDLLYNLSGYHTGMGKSRTKLALNRI